MPIILVNRVVDTKRIIGKWMANEEEVSLTKKITIFFLIFRDPS
jgi:hypothetical protein